MRFLVANMKAGTILSTPTLTIGTFGSTGTFASPYYFFSVVPACMSLNGTPELVGENIPVTYESGTVGTGYTLQWTPDGRASWYSIYKGTANGTFGTYLYFQGSVSGTLGTYTIGTELTAGASAGSKVMSYTNAMYLPNPVTYKDLYVNNIVVSEFANKDILIYDKATKPTFTFSFEQITDAEKTDLQTVFNWRSAFKFLPNSTGTASNVFDTYWTGNFDFTLTTPSFVNGGWNGAVQFNSTAGNVPARAGF